jgi:aminopeptidase
MSREAFEDFYYRVSSVDYGKMSLALEPLKELMDHTDRVRILGPGTDLSFRIAGIPAIPCAGEFNLPDGEIFTAPIRDSAEGVIHYNADSIHDGFRYSDVQFRFKKGQIVEATASDTERINAALDIDEGARYLGEFALGVNPFVDRVVGDTLFDEKIRGSVHLTPGACYDEAPNGNDSALHWDLVLLQDAESGGGEIHFDDRLIRKDGRFVVPELEGLNPENLA